MKKLSNEGYWTTVRVNPLFPTHPDGFFTNPNFKWSGDVPVFNYSTTDLIDAVADHNVPAILVGFARLSSLSLKCNRKSVGSEPSPVFRQSKRVNLRGTGIIPTKKFFIIIINGSSEV
ncbi:MAG: hypothetical protein R3A80_10075 [Bdellovibrionota bacterium]